MCTGASVGRNTTQQRRKPPRHTAEGGRALPPTDRRAASRLGVPEVLRTVMVANSHTPVGDSADGILEGALTTGMLHLG